MILLPDPEDNLTDVSIKAIVMTLEPMKTRFQRLRDMCDSANVTFTMAKAPEMPTHFYMIKNRFQRPQVPLIIDSICGLMKYAEQSSSYVNEVHRVDCESIALRGVPAGRAAPAQNAQRKP